MHKVTFLFFIIVSFLLIENFLFDNSITSDSRFNIFIADPSKDSIAFFLKNNDGKYYNTFSKLDNELNKKNFKLVFATNGGMFMQNYFPLGLYIENGKKISSVNKRNGKTNFYLKPNGIFYLTFDNNSAIVKTEDFIYSRRIKFATQSGPMLVIDGKMNPAFKIHSINLNIRSGVGILKNGKIVFALSKVPVNFYDFAKLFQQMKCENALFLDGGISEFYLPAERITQSYQNFGVIIGIIKKNNN